MHDRCDYEWVPQLQRDPYMPECASLGRAARQQQLQGTVDNAQLCVLACIYLRRAKGQYRGQSAEGLIERVTWISLSELA